MIARETSKIAQTGAAVINGNSGREKCTESVNRQAHPKSLERMRKRCAHVTKKDRAFRGNIVLARHGFEPR